MKATWLQQNFSFDRTLSSVGKFFMIVYDDPSFKFRSWYVLPKPSILLTGVFLPATNR